MNGVQSSNTTYSIGKKILQIDERGNVVKEWNSATEIAKAFEIQRQVILGCCYNNTGFDWKFKEDKIRTNYIINNLIKKGVTYENYISCIYECKAYQ